MTTLRSVLSRFVGRSAVALACFLVLSNSASPADAAPADTTSTDSATSSKLAPMRALPQPRAGKLVDGVKRFVHPERGDDAADGGETTPWRTLAHAVRRLQPGDTLYLRGGTYYEKTSLSRSGTADAPITIAAYPGELAVVDGGRREFFAHPAASWEPAKDGAPDEYVSTQTFADVDARRVPTHALPGNWEPLWGVEDDRPLALGHFADSMVPLHGYRTPADLRSMNEYWLAGKHEDRATGNYCGPGLWFNRETGRVHVRLSHTKLAGLGNRAYVGETDPRKVRLHVALGFGDDVMRIVGVKHVVLRDLVFRGATGSPMLHVYGSQHVTLDHCTVYGGSPELLVNASQNIRVVHSAFRGLAAPWTSRAHMKYRGTPSYQIIFQNNQPVNENIEFANCEFTDDHDFSFFRFVKNLQFHHNLVDNFNDDGMECGPKLRDHRLFIYQNRIGRCLIPLSQHEFTKDESPVDHDAGSGVYFYRNVVDLRGGTYKFPPAEADPTGSFLHVEGHVAGDHGGPIWPVMRFYHNTFLRNEPVFRDAYLFGLATAGLRHNERDVFNNLFVEADKLPGVKFIAIKEAGHLREGGNILWGMAAGPQLAGDPFAAFRATPLFEQSKLRYEAGWTTHDRFADPQFVRGPSTSGGPHDSGSVDLRLKPQSPAVDTGLVLAAEWPDPLRESDRKKPDVGALPLDVEPWGVGVDGRLSPFGGEAK